MFEHRFLLLLTALALTAIAMMPAWGDEDTRVTLEIRAESSGETVVSARTETGDKVTLYELWRGRGEVAVIDSGVDPGSGFAFARFGVRQTTFYAVSHDGGATWTPGQTFERAFGLQSRSVGLQDEMPPVPSELRLPSGGELYVVQFKFPSQYACRSRLNAAGARILSSLPPNAHVVRVAPSHLDELRSQICVERVEPFHPGYRLDRSLNEWLLEPDAEPRRRRIHVIVPRRDRLARQRLAELARWSGAETAQRSSAGSVLPMIVTRDQLLSLVRSDDFLWGNAMRTRRGAMDVVREHTGANWAEASANGGICGVPVRIEVMDCYLQWDHPDFLSNPPTIHGTSPEEHLDDGDPGTDNLRDECIASGEEQHEHGSSAYGIALGDGSSDPEDSDYQPGEGKSRGMLPCGEGVFTSYWYITDDVANTAELTDPDGTSCDGGPCLVSVSSRSFGGYDEGAYNTWSYQADEGIWKYGLSMVQAMGNRGRTSTPDRAFAEALAKNNIVVGGIHHADATDPNDDFWCEHDCGSLNQTDCEADFHCGWNAFLNHCFDDYDSCASRGPATDGRIKPDVSLYYDQIHTTGDTGHRQFAGTSAATPQVAGVLGLVLEAWRDNAWGNCADCAGLTAFDVRPSPACQKALLINSASQWSFAAEGDDLDRYRQGWGLPKIQAARQRAIASLVLDQAGPVQAGEVFSQVIEVTDQDLKVSLVYSEPPSVPPATPALINDLDLRVISPSGEIYCGNFGLDSGMQSTPITPMGYVSCFDTQSGTEPAPRDSLNNVENVFVDGAETGDWTLEVEAVTVLEDQSVQGGCEEHTDQTSCELAGCTWGSEFCGDGVADVAFALVATWSDCPDVPHGVTPPSDPQALMVDKAADGFSAHLSWDASPEAYVTGYNVYRATNLEGPDRSQAPAGWRRIGTTASTELIDDSGFAGGEFIHFFDVRAVDEYCRHSELPGGP